MGIFDLFKKKEKTNGNLTITSTQFIPNQNSSNELASFDNRHTDALSKINIEALKESSSISSITLLPKEILFLSYLDSKKAEPAGIAGYWTYRYELSFQVVLDKLFKHGYLKFADKEKTVRSQKLQDLKILLSEHSLPTSGKKDNLVNTILSNVPENSIFERFPDRYFEVTPFGQILISQNEHILYVHKNGKLEISIDRIDALKKQYPNLNKYELCHMELLKRQKETIQARNYGLYRNALYQESLIRKDSGDKKAEIELLLEVCYLDLSGCGNNNTFEPKLAFLAPGIITALKSCMNELNMKISDIKKIFDTITFPDIPLPAECIKNISFSKIKKELSEKPDNNSS